jgi:phosphoglycolate phosphatase
VARALLFDLDGTLSDPRDGIIRSIGYALDRLGVAVPPAAQLEQFIGPPLREAFASLLGGPEHVEDAITLYRERYGTKGAYENELYPGIADVLGTLAGDGLPLYVATSKPHVYARAIVEHFGISACFRQVYGCEWNGDRSNKAELLAHLLTEEGLEPSPEVVMIGDRHHDIRAARAHGLTAVGVTWGFGSEHELREAGADRICTAVGDLAILGSLR